MMDYSKFRQLVKEGEKPTVDYKIDSDAFNSKLKTPNAELAKDVCAMANNGNVSSYIIVGVSDDGQSFQSVKNSKLTDDNLQSFCKTAIFPPPKVKVLSQKWVKGASNDHKGKKFIIIQVGPQPRQAFHLAKDFIDYTEKLCLRRNEVWIRRGST
jgi:predicted HTH transcriptional regulator